MAKPRLIALPAGTVTFLLTDVAGSTRAWQEDPERTAAAIAAHYEVIDEAVSRHNGFRPQEQGEGDSTVTAFARASDGVAAALDLQCSLEAHPTTKGLVVRCALHTGDALLRDDRNYFGAALNRCARLRDLAYGGQILLSHVTAGIAHESLPPDASLVDLGQHRLKDLARAEHVFMLCHPDLASDFPPLRSLDALPHNLPTQLSSFIPRNAEVGEIGTLLGSSRLVTVTGSGGCGKTRLALQVGAELLDRFPDGVWFVDLAPLHDPQAVPDQALAALSLREGPMQTSEDALAAFLRERRSLILLDNCEHLIAACADLSTSLLTRCPGVSILATSREPLGVAGEVRWRVPSLDVPAADLSLAEPELLAQYGAVRLFIERATEAHPDFAITTENVAAVADICRKLEGIPLAIELAAARVRLMPPQQIRDALNDRFRILTGGSRTAQLRQKTLEASVAWSYDLLTETEQILLARLSVFAGGVTLQAAERVCGVEPLTSDEILDALSSLVDKSLVQVDDSANRSRYKLLESIRQFAGRRLFDQDSFAEMRSRHAGFFLDLLGDAETPLERGDDRTLLDLESEMDNLSDAVEWALLSGDNAAVLNASWPLALLAVPTGRSTQITPWIQAALDYESGDTELRAQGLLALGTIAQYKLDLAGALQRNEQALTIYGRLGDRRGAARARAFVACERFMLEGSSEAVELMEHSLEEGRALSDNVTVKFTLVAGLGWANTYTDLVKARDYLEQGLAFAPGAGLINQALILSFLAWLAICQGRWRDALRIAAEATEASGKVRFAQCYALTLHGDALLGLGRLQEARQDLLEAKRIGEETQDIGVYRYTLHTLARLELAEGNLDSALELAQRSVAMTAMMAPQFQSASLLSLSRVLLGRDQDAEAIETLERVIEIGRDSNLQWSLANACNLRAVLLIKSGDYRQAEALCSEAIRLFREGQSVAGVIDCLETISHMAAGVGEELDATRLVAVASCLRQETGYATNPKDEARIRNLVEYLKDDLRENFAGAWDEGKGLDMDGAVEYALHKRGERHQDALERPLSAPGRG